MSKIGDRLRKAIADQQHLRPEHPPAISNAQIEAAFRPVCEAAEELHLELSHVPGLEIAVQPDQVRIELYDRYFWFRYAPDTGKFVGSELTSLWMEGGVHEEDFTWDSANACIEAMIQACARYVSMAESLARLKSG